MEPSGHASQTPGAVGRERFWQGADGRDAEDYRRREKRPLRCTASKAKVEISHHFNNKQQVFLDFVLSHYVTVGVEELDQEKLTPLLRLKYHNSIADAVADLGKPEEIGQVFAGFQKYLYQPQIQANP